MTIGAIPVKKDSMRLPDKNFLSFNGKPLIQLAIERLAPNVDEILISTDAPAAVQQVLSNIDLDHFGIPINLFERQPRHSFGDIPADVPIKYMLRKIGVDPETLIVMTQVTTPLATDFIIKTCICRFNDRKPDMLTTVFPDYIPNGAVYVCKARQFMDKPNIYSGRVFLVVLDYAQGLDIDYYYQHAIAEAVARGDVAREFV